jgi:hypothetical protein
VSVKTSDVPFLRGDNQKGATVADAKSESKPESKAAAGKLAPAAASGDPEVHALLAELETAKSNDDDDAVQAVTKKLADLGFE